MDQTILPYDIWRFDYKERLNDRFLTTHLHRFEMFSRPVAIAVVIEILNPWHPTSEIGQRIIHSIIREFSRREAQSFLGRFELSLKYTNRIVQEAITKLDTSVSCVALLLETDQVHCAGIGSAKLGLFRSGHLSTIVGGKQPMSLFSSVTSGDLRQGDWLCLANADYYAQFESMDAHNWSAQDPAGFINGLVDEKEAATDSYWAGLLFRFNQSPAPEIQDDIVTTDTQSSINQTIFWEADKQSKARSLPKLNFKPAREVLPSIQLGSLLAALRQFAIRTAANIRQVFKRRQLNDQEETGPFRRFLPLALAILAVAALVVGWRYFQRSYAPSTPVTPTLISAIESLPASSQLQGLIDNFSVKSYESLSDAEKERLTTFLQPQQIFLTSLEAPITQISDPISASDAFATGIALVDNQGQVWLYKDGVVSKSSQKQLVASPVAISATAENRMLVSDTSGNIWLLNGTADAPIALVQPKSLTTSPKTLSSFQKNLYIAPTDQKITFRVLNFNDDLSSAAVYNKGDSLTLSAISDLAVNGSVVAVDNSGKVAGYPRNKAATFSASLPVIDGTFRLAASDEATSIAVSSGRIIYLLDQAGSVTKTIFLTTDNKITDISLDSSSPNLLWLAIGNQLYQLPL